MSPRIAWALAGCLWACTDPMAAQPRSEPYEASTFFADGRAMRTPPAGTVPRERKLGESAFETGRGPDGTWAKELPMKVTAELLVQGRARFERVCANCHGLLGDGVSIPARNMALRPAPSLIDRPREPGFVYSAITFGYGLMVPFAGELDPQERWAIAAYLEALRRSQNASLDAAPAEVQRRLEEEARP